MGKKWYTDMRIRDFGFLPGTMTPGPGNSITDVPGVTVGQTTHAEGDLHTGVTVVIPASGNLFFNKLTAACYVHNGFGKACGLMQIEELGTLETPIALTGTLNVGLVSDALVSYTLEQCQRDGIAIRSLNPVVGECNDGRLSHIALRPVHQQDVYAAIASASQTVPEGAVGAGAGTICFGLKGGIGTASRVCSIDGNDYTLGVLVQSNFGSTEDLTICGRAIGAEILPLLERKKYAPTKVDAGSIMMILATDLPVSSRQLRRIIRRCGVGLARTGSYLGHGSGEVMIGFTTANRIPMEGPSTLPLSILREDMLDIPFRAAAEATEEAVLNSLAAAHTVTGYQDLTVYGLEEFLSPSSSGPVLRAL